MRRNSTWLVLPPVATITALRARKLIVGCVLSIFPSARKLFSGIDEPGMIRGLYCTVMPSTRLVVIASLAQDAGHFVIQQKPHAFLARARFQRPSDQSAIGGVGTFQTGAFFPHHVILPRRRVASGRRAMIVRCLIIKNNTVVEQEFECRSRNDPRRRASPRGRYNENPACHWAARSTNR